MSMPLVLLIGRKLCVYSWSFVRMLFSTSYYNFEQPAGFEGALVVVNWD